MNEILKFDTFTEFCEKKNNIKDEFNNIICNNDLLKCYRNYIYNHKFVEQDNFNQGLCDKIWEWLFDDCIENDLYSMLGVIKRGS